MELFNSKVDHKVTLCDKSKWGVDLCRRSGSENCKLLCDPLSHADQLEGDVILRTIQDNTSTSGIIASSQIVPGQHETDENQNSTLPSYGLFENEQRIM